MMKVFVILLLSIGTAIADQDPRHDPNNYCYDADGWESIDKLHREVPEDPIVIRMYAMRKGLCILIEEGKISRDQAVDIFELERLRSVIERRKEKMMETPDIRT